MISMQVNFTEEQFRHLSKLAKRRKKGLVEMLVDEAMKLSPEEKAADRDEPSVVDLRDVVVPVEEAATGGVVTHGDLSSVDDPVRAPQHDVTVDVKKVDAKKK